MRLAAVAAAAAAALVFVAGASAHGTVSPTVATPGTVQQFTFAVFNGEERGIVGFRLQLPAGATVQNVTARQPTWTATSTATSIEWRGGPIPGRAFDSFEARIRTPEREGTVSFLGSELFEDGARPPTKFDVVIAGGVTAASGETTDEGARTLAKAALFAAVVAALLAAASLALTLVRRRPG